MQLTAIPSIVKRAYIWCRRIRHRRGYGVHSPFAFSLLTDVVYERRPYYAYRELDRLQPSGSLRYPRRVCRLLFRLANRFQPRRIVEVGAADGLTLRYLSAACPEAVCLSVADEGELQRELDSHPQADLLHIAHTDRYREAFECGIAHAGEQTLLVIEGIYDNRPKREWWQQVVADERTGITFDLYDLGLVFCNRRMNKQHYVVNF